MKFRWFFIIICIYLTGFFAHALSLQKTVYGDGIYYFSWLHSLVFNRDIQFQNEFTHFQVGSTTTQLGLPGNKFSIGAPLLWLPTYLMHVPLLKGTGYEFPYQLVVGATSVLYVLFGLALLCVTLTRFFDRQIATVTTIAIALSTHLLFYGSIDTVNSHGVSFFAAVLYLYFLLAPNQKSSPTRSGIHLSSSVDSRLRGIDTNHEKKENWLLIGAALGLISIIRLNDIVYAILLIPLFSRKTILQVVIGFFSIFIIQLFAWQTVYGKFWVSPYFLEGERFNIFHPHVREVLFSISNGLFLWTPMVLMGVLGLCFWKKSERRWFLLIFFSQLLLVSSWSTWSEGASFSGRMFVSTLPICAFGVACLFSYLKKIGWTQKLLGLILVGPLSLINVLLIFYYLLVH